MREFFSDRANLWMAGVFVIAAYLSLVNLGHSPLWHDEAPIAFVGENLWRNQSLSAWNGRSLFTNDNGTAANSDLILASFPPWTPFPSALGIGLFGANEFGVRIFHTLLGLASLLLFWQLLRLDFASRPRLRVIAFLLFALSTQTILFFRFGRYVADAFFFTFLAFYAYRLYIAPGGRAWHLALASIATLLNFLNQFAIGAAFALAMSVWHLMFHARSTTLRQWLQIGAAAALTAGLCLFYLVEMGILFSDEVLEHSESIYKIPWAKRKLLLTYYNFRELITFGHLPVWVALWAGLWFLHAAGRRLWERWKMWRKQTAQRRQIADSSTQIVRWSVLMALFLAFSGLFSVGNPDTHPFANMRYIAPVLAVCALIIAALADAIWRHAIGGAFAIPLLAAVLCSNALAFPSVYAHWGTGKKFNILLPSLIIEVHDTNYRTYLGEIRDYLNEHAAQDDTIIISSWQNYAVLLFYLGDKMIFCCALNADSPLPEEKVRALDIPIYQHDLLPRWVVHNGTMDAGNIPFELAYEVPGVPYSINRPDIHSHIFHPQPRAGGGIRIFRGAW